jgi:hypothetical protein
MERPSMDAEDDDREEGGGSEDGQGEPRRVSDLVRLTGKTVSTKSTAKATTKTLGKTTAEITTKNTSETTARTANSKKTAGIKQAAAPTVKIPSQSHTIKPHKNSISEIELPAIEVPDLSNVTQPAGTPQRHRAPARAAIEILDSGGEERDVWIISSDEN